MAANWGNRPTIVSADEFRQLQQQHGPVIHQYIQNEAEVQQDPSKPYMYILQFQDGTSITVAAPGQTMDMLPVNGEVPPAPDAQPMDFTSGAYSGNMLIADYGTVGQQMQEQEKQQARNQQFEIREVGGKLLQIFGDGSTKVLMDVPATPQAAPAGQFERAQQDYDATVKFLQQEIAAGRMTPSQASRELASIRESAMRGSTRFEEEQLAQRKSEFDRNMQMEQLQSARNYAQNQAQTGAGLFNQRVSSGSSVANNLFQGATETFGKILPGTGPDSMYNFNPFELAKNFVTDLGGGPGTYQMASQMMQSSLAPEIQPGYWLGTPDAPGDPGIPEEFVDQEDYPISPEFVSQGPGVVYNQGGTGGGVEPEYLPNGLPIWAAGSAGGY